MDNLIFTYCSTIDFEINIEYLLLYVCISCRLENIAFEKGGVVARNILGKTIMKKLSFVVYQARIRVHSNGILIYNDNDQLWEDNKHTVNSVEIIDSSIVGDGIAVFTTYHVNIAINNSFFHHFHKEIMSFHATVPIEVLIEKCAFKLNLFHWNGYYSPHRLPMIQFLMLTKVNTTTNITFLNCDFHHNNGYVPLILMEIVET